MNLSEGYFIGIDIGTTGTRASVFDLSGKQRGYCYEEYQLLTDAQGKAELPPDKIFDAFIHVTKNCILKNRIGKNSIEGIGISAQMHSLIAMDEHGNCLTNAITWADMRPAGEARFIGKNYDAQTLYQETGCRVQHPAYYLSKILWLEHTRPEIVEKTYKFVTIKEYILFRLYGEYVIDISDASTTACYNIHSFQWDDAIIRDILHMTSDRFGEPVSCTHILRGMKQEYAGALGIDPSVPIVAGSSDGIMAHLGSGGMDSGTMSCSIGTSGAMRAAVSKPLLDRDGKTWCYCFTKNKWIAGGAVNNGGIVLKWFRDQLDGRSDKNIAEYGVKNAYQLFDRYADEIAPGSDGLLFLPYLTGERSPGWHTDASAFICGLKYSHDKRHIIRAAMEGILYNMYSIFEVLSGIDSHAQKIIANGGYVNSRIWLQMQADIFGREIIVSDIGEAASLGAAITAMVAVGAVRGFDSVRQDFDQSRVYYPNVENHEVYKNCYKRFRAVYDVLIDKKF